MSSNEYLIKLIILPLAVMVPTIVVLRGPWLKGEYQGKVDYIYLYQNMTEMNLGGDEGKLHAVNGLGWTNFTLLLLYLLILGLYQFKALPTIVKTYTFRINLIPMICLGFYIAMIITGFTISTEIDCEGYDEVTRMLCRELENLKISHGWALYVTFVPMLLTIVFMIGSFIYLERYVESFEQDYQVGQFAIGDDEEDLGQTGRGGNPMHNNGGNSMYNNGGNPMHNNGGNPMYNNGGNPMHNNGGNPIHNNGGNSMHNNANFPSLMDQQRISNNQILQTIIQSMTNGDNLSLDQVKESQRIIKFQYEQEVFQIKKQEMLLQQQRQQQESRANVLHHLRQQEEMLSLQNNINDTEISLEQQFINLHHNLENNKY